MAVLRTVLLLLPAIPLAGCIIDSPFTSQVTVNRHHPLHEFPILVDPSLTPRTNDVSPDRGLFRTKTDQRIVIDYDGPLKLVPATPEDVAAMQAGQPQSPRGGSATAAPTHSATPPAAYPESLRR